MSLLLLYQNNNILAPVINNDLYGGGGGWTVRHPHVTDDRERKIRQEKILIEESELIAIVEMTLQHFII